MTNPEYLFDLYRKAVTAWVDHFAPSMGAAISCYSMLSLVPLLIIAIAGVAAFGSWTPGLLPDWELLLQGVNVRVSIGITTALFVMIFKFTPTAPIGWPSVRIGAIVTAVLFEIGRIAIGVCLGKSGVNESFAAAGSLVVSLAGV